MTIEKIRYGIPACAVIAAAMLIATVVGAVAAGQPYTYVGKPPLGITSPEANASFDAASEYCDQRYGANNDKTGAHKKCMLDRGWRLEKFVSCGSTMLHRSC
jgi:hypothetical protein